MKVTPPPAARIPTPREIHNRRCFLLGITLPEKVEQLWKQELAKIAAAREAEGYRPGNRHGGA